MGLQINFSDRLYGYYLKTDYFFDKVPLLSNVTNAINILFKSAMEVIKHHTKKTTFSNRYWEHINNKTFKQCFILLLLPIIGNIYVYRHYHALPKQQTPPSVQKDSLKENLSPLISGHSGDIISLRPIIKNSLHTTTFTTYPLANSPPFTHSTSDLGKTKYDLNITIDGMPFTPSLKNSFYESGSPLGRPIPISPESTFSKGADISVITSPIKDSIQPNKSILKSMPSTPLNEKKDGLALLESIDNNMSDLDFEKLLNSIPIQSVVQFLKEEQDRVNQGKDNQIFIRLLRLSHALQNKIFLEDETLLCYLSLSFQKKIIDRNRHEPNQIEDNIKNYLKYMNQIVQLEFLATLKSCRAYLQYASEAVQCKIIDGKQHENVLLTEFASLPVRSNYLQKYPTSDKKISTSLNATSVAVIKPQRKKEKKNMTPSASLTTSLVTPKKLGWLERLSPRKPSNVS